ncbi:type II toxin-antitoxin system YafQ family toxin [Companilactobacillus nodensis]|uniref:Addiction module toxin RelE n=1 Tax=Companilactobacillus nodensis DSM 19682 = JCM 14932 = NBRC 107160 TaxID=1423775 RepID=A0A0R1K749_9LACO|nr:type II toxin-antitoxin system YafQ family toxin [Companilactobacillus nodensis]KRK79096.1 hypothetical protein FD03_GL001459 [Companilactobacillus nodensis DSM 19682 = JCM 14932 = NBRC 107160]
MLDIVQTPAFVKNYKKLQKKHYDVLKLKTVITHIVNRDEDILKTRYSDHALTGNWRGYRELHIEKNWLLVYIIIDKELTLVLIRTGSHDDIFKRNNHWQLF